MKHRIRKAACEGNNNKASTAPHVHLPGSTFAMSDGHRDNQISNKVVTS